MREGEYGALLGDPIEGNEELGIRNEELEMKVAASPPFYWDDARKWHLSYQSLVTPTIREKESSHMRGIRSFGSVPTCSGWGFSHIEHFRPLRMTIREGGWFHRLAVSPPFLEDGILVSQPSPRGEGAPQGRIG